MSIKHARAHGLPGYQFDDGDIFVYNADDPIAKGKARQQAMQSGQKHDVVKSPTFDIKKFYEEEQLIFGWASVAKDKEGNRPIEWQGDEIEMSEMEPAIYDFVKDQGITKEMHKVEKARGTVVESVVFTKEKMASMGIPEGTVPEGWWVGFKVNDVATFKKVKAGIYKMFSIEGKGVRSAIGGE